MSTTLTKSPTQVPASPRNPLTLLRQEVDDLINRFWDGEQEASWFKGAFAPAADLIEEANAFEVRMDIPGMDAREVDVQVHGNVLTVSGKRSEEPEKKGRTFRRVERRSGDFSRTLLLPCNVNENEVAAEYNQGVLTVKLPKCDEAKAKKIKVKA